MSNLEAIWSRIKIAADEQAQRGHIVTQEHAEGIIRKIFHEFCSQAPPDALKFLSGELVLMCQERLNKLAKKAGTPTG